LLRGGDHEAVIAGGPYLARFLDTFCRAQIGYRVLQEDALYNIVDLVVSMVGDNHIRAISESWEFWTDVDVFKLAVPANKTKHGYAYYLDAIYRLKDKFEEMTGAKMEDERLKEEINLFNRIRDLLGRISSLRKNGRPKITGKDFMALNHASYYADRHYLVDALGFILQDLQNNDADVPTGPRIMLIGSTLALGEFMLVDLLEEAGSYIVFEDFTEGMRHYADLVDIDGNPMNAIADRYFMKRIPPAYAKPATGERFEYFLEKANEFNVDGFVWYSLMYRDIYDMEGFLFEKTAKKRGLPLLKISSDYDYSEKEALRTRVEAFIEMIGGRARS
jgi:benzoyl-CoA reductase/2-hydroxyglutaryl-CoA dehydratase subunit BcrC/BadD/HgdB